MIIPEQLAANCRNHPERQAWLDGLPAMLEELTSRWSLGIESPFEHADVTACWIAPVVCADGMPAVLKLAMPHMEGAQEILGLRLWNGDPTVRLLEADDSLGAMLLERCQPGYALRSEPEHEQDMIIATLLRRLWKRSAASNNLQQFRHLSAMLEYWRDETLAQARHWPDAGLVREGLQTCEALAKPLPTDVLLSTDLHAGNVLRSTREPWLVIDPKPFVGDPPYDVTQHLCNCQARLHADPVGVIARLADLCEVDRERLRLWTFARAASDPRSNWTNTVWLDVARALAP